VDERDCKKVEKNLTQLHKAKETKYGQFACRVQRKKGPWEPEQTSWNKRGNFAGVDSAVSGKKLERGYAAKALSRRPRAKHL